MKCVIASIAGRAQVIDLCHGIPRQDVRAGALALRSAAPWLPPGAIVVAVVDPGVGTERRAIAIDTRRATLVGPDNGLLSLAAADLGPRRAVELRDRRFFLPEVSSTFHGRDVFAPVAAHLARGARLRELGPPIDGWSSIDVPTAVRTRGGARGEVVRVDVYGNAITNVSNDWASIGAPVRARKRTIARVVRSYGDVPIGEVAAVPSSDGTLEIAVNGGHAADQLGLRVGDAIELGTRA